MKKIILPATFLAAMVSVAHAAPETVTVDVELTETAKKDSETLSVTMTLAEEHSCARVASDGKHAYELEVCRGAGDTMSFDIRTARRRMKVSSKLEVGKRVVVGRIARGDDSTEVAATVR
jgi:hypothetical protein